ncbi:MAG: fumarylacetoacetate hydrolase family protein [Oscillospiraceae bacterium]|nr:fumarylacetoacetate hydrolase family protein [Oscillospiraceae bacterium]MDY6207274.1 fumarylacetoacetate hydrolase family protein [Oscillospiraceae bacterium]
MKLITFLYNSEEIVGAVTPDGQRAVPCSELGVSYTDMETLASYISNEELCGMKERLAGASGGIPLSEVKLLAPVPRPSRDIICLGVNFKDHAEESVGVMGAEYGGERKYPIYFAKHVNEAVPCGDYINGHFDIVTELDYEAEMAFIVRKDAVNVKAENAGEYVFGYTIMNDVSARCIQMRHKQWFRGKSFDGFAPMGPCLVTADEFEFPPKLDISCKVNGELRQKSNTALYIHNIPYALEELSSGMVIKAGTIISMGTPGGVGMGFKPPKYLKSGDVIECEVQGIGKLVNEVK